MKKYFNLFAAVIALIGLFSCSDDSSSPAVEDIKTNIFSYNNINNAAFTESRLDSASNSINSVEGMLYKLADTTLLNLPAMQYSKFINRVASQTQYYRTNTDASEFYVYSDCVNELVYKLSPYGNSVKFPFELPQMWVKVGDKKNTSWNIYSKYLENFVVVEGMAVTSGTLTITGKRGASGTINVNGVTSASQEFIIHFNYNGTLVGQSTVLDLNFDLKYYFAEGKGIVKIVIPYTLLNIGMPFPINGYNYIVTSINQGII